MTLRYRCERFFINNDLFSLVYSGIVVIAVPYNLNLGFASRYQSFFEKSKYLHWVYFRMIMVDFYQVGYKDRIYHSMLGDHENYSHPRF